MGFRRGTLAARRGPHQGDKRDQLMTELAKKGWKVKRVGG
jgi:translation initiation factor 1 (eIF-1/SUI1)